MDSPNFSNLSNTQNALYIVYIVYMFKSLIYQGVQGFYT